MFSLLSTLHFKLKKLNNRVHLFWRLYHQASLQSNHRALHIDPIHVCMLLFTFQWLTVYGCQLVKNLTKMHKFTRWCDRTALHCITLVFLVWNAIQFQTMSYVSLPRAPHGLEGGDIWHFRLILHAHEKGVVLYLHKTYPLYLHGHFHFNCWMWIISYDLKIFKFEAVNVFNIPFYLQSWKWAWLSCKLSKEFIVINFSLFLFLFFSAMISIWIIKIRELEEHHLDN